MVTRCRFERTDIAGDEVVLVRILQVLPHSSTPKWTPVLLREALLAHDVYVCLERPSGALPPETLHQQPDHLKPEIRTRPIY